MAGILFFALLAGSLAQWFGPRPIPWFEDHSKSPRSKAQAAGVGILTLEQARDVVASGSALILDARLPGEFEAGHLPGAVSFPNATRSETYYELAALVPPNQLVLVYCSASTCDDALELAIFLRQQGSKKVLLFPGGFRAWSEAGFPVE